MRLPGSCLAQETEPAHFEMSGGGLPLIHLVATHPRAEHLNRLFLLDVPEERAWRWNTLLYNWQLLLATRWSQSLFFLIPAIVLLLLRSDGHPKIDCVHPRLFSVAL